ncbi:MAG: Uma2 family endonuclease [Cyanobacteria bacterium P01_F01_bin.150]
MLQAASQPQSFLLELPDSLGLYVSQEQFIALAQANQDLRLERTATGELIVNPPTGGVSGKRNFSITGQLNSWVEAHESLGEGFDSSTGFELPNGADRSPDASWVRCDRWEALTLEEQEGFIPLCPDFVIELRSKISKTDSLTKLQEKMQEYMDNGAQLGWLIDPQNKRVEIYRMGQAVELLEQPSTLSGENVLPGFTLMLKCIWS